MGTRYSDTFPQVPPFLHHQRVDFSTDHMAERDFKLTLQRQKFVDSFYADNEGVLSEFNGCHVLFLLRQQETFIDIDVVKSFVHLLNPEQPSMSERNEEHTSTAALPIAWRATFIYGFARDVDASLQA